MKYIKRCYGCGEIILPWQDTIDTKKVGPVHNERGCILDAWYKLSEEEGDLFGSDPILLEALSALADFGEEE